MSAATEAPQDAVPDGTAAFEATLRYFLGPIVSFLDDATVSEVMINGPDEIYIERAGKLELTEARFPSQDRLKAAVTNIAQFVGRTLDENTMRLDARLPDGSRVHIVQPPCSRRGTVVAIRKFSKKSFDLSRLVELGSMTQSAQEFLELCVRMRKNIIVSGGTGTGKTSFLNAMSRAIPTEERIIVIEDSSELQLQQPHVVQLEAKMPDHRGRGGVSIRDLFVSTLRLRPDRIVIGEVRGSEALDLLQAMTSGHPGSMSTLHADRPVDALRRLETMAMMGSVDLPHHAVRSQVASAVHVVVQLARFADGSRRLTDIAESHPLEGSEPYRLTPIYAYRQEGVDPDGKVRGALHECGTAPSFTDQAKSYGFAQDWNHSRGVWEGTPTAAGGA